MSDYRFYDLLRAELSEQILEESAQIASGIVGDWADFKSRVGHINGLRSSLVVAEEVFRKLTE